MELRRSLVSQHMKKIAEYPLSHAKVSHVLIALSNDAALFGKRCGAAEVAKAWEKIVQTGEKLRLVQRVFKRLRECKPTLDCSTNLVVAPAGEHQRQCECLLQNHLLSGAAAHDVEKIGRAHV